AELCAGRAAAGLAAGIPLAAAGAMGRAPRRRAPARTPPHAAARTFLADPVWAAFRWCRRAGEGRGGKDGRSATRLIPTFRMLRRPSRRRARWFCVLSHKDREPLGCAHSVA